MRIAHLIQSSTHIYGAERCLLLELSTLRQRGHDAHVVMLMETRQGPDAGVLKAALEAQGVPVHPVEARRQASPQMLWELYRQLARLSPQVVHSHSMKTDVLGYMMTRPLRVPFLVEVHGWLRPDYDRVVRLYEALDQRLLRRCEGTIVLSRDYEREVRGLGGRRVFYLPSGIDIAGLRQQVGRRDLRRELGLPANAVVFGMVARLSPEKGHRDFLWALRQARAAAQPGDPPIVGLILGEGPLRDELGREAADLGDGVRFAGYVAEVADAYRALDVLVSCSLYEGLPLNLIEAMALGVPVLSMATGGCADIVVDGETGVLTPRGDRAALLSGMQRLAAEPGLRARMGAAGAARADACYSLEAWGSGVEAVYQALATRGGRA